MSDFEMIESLFEELLLLSANIFSTSEILEVRKFVNAGEYGVALDTLVDIFNEEKKSATPEIIALIKNLAVAMALEPNDYVRRLAVP